MSILFGLISLLLSILLPVLITFFTGFEVMRFSIFFIVPIGALIIGYICGYGYFKGLSKSNTFVSRRHFIIGLILSLICILGIKYATYMVTCVDPYTSEIVYTLDGAHVSNYVMEGYGELDFLTYNQYMIETTPISFINKGHSLGEVSNPIVGWIFAIIDYLGVAVGCLFYGFVLRDQPYCHKCMLYKKEKEFFKLSKINGSEFFKKIEGSLSNIDMDESFNSLINEFKLDDSIENEEYYLCKIIYCEECKESLLSFSLYEFNSKKKLSENTEFNHVIDVKYDLVKEFLTEASMG